MLRLLFPLLLITTIPSCWGFVFLQRCPRSTRVAPPWKNVKELLKAPSYSDALTTTSIGITALYDAHGSGDNNQNNNDTNDNDNSTFMSVANSIKKIIFKTFDTMFLLFSYAIQFLGGLFSIGLLLNLCGYAYMFGLEHGLEIDRIYNIWALSQFRGEVQRID
jgi:hypothetical protein